MRKVVVDGIGYEFKNVESLEKSNQGRPKSHHRKVFETMKHNEQVKIRGVTAKKLRSIRAAASKINTKDSSKRIVVNHMKSYTKVTCLPA